MPTVLDKLAFNLGRRDEIPNQELAHELARSRNEEDIRLLVQNLWNANTAIRSDCLKTLYELGYLKPELIAPYGRDFRMLLQEKNNRLVWGGMIALACIAELKAEELFPHVQEIIAAMDRGSVITVDHGIRALARIAAGRPEYNREIFPYLLHHLATCRAKEVPQHAEAILAAVTAENKAEFLAVLEKWLPEMHAARLRRMKKTMKEAESR